MINYAFSDEFLKLAAVTREEAEDALKKLRKLEETKPTIGDIARGMLAGSAAGTAAMTANSLIGGKMREGIQGALKQPTLRGKVTQLGKSAIKNVGAAAGGSAAFGATLPIARGHLDREAQKEKLREYIGHAPRSRLQREVRKVTGL